MQSKPGSWITPYGEVETRQLASTLYRLASEHAQRAVAATHAGESGLAKVDRITSIGAAAELLLKSTLAGVSATLLAGNSGTATLAELSGRRIELHQKPNAYKVATVGAAEAVKRLNPLLPETHSISSRENLFDVRNSAIHMGVLPTDAEYASVIGDLQAFVDEVLRAREHLGLLADRAKFWSDTYVNTVDAIRDNKLEAIRASVTALIDTAKANYARLVRNVDPDKQLELVNELSLRTEALHYLREMHRCPACQNSTLAALYDVSREVEIDDSDAPISFGFTVSESATLDFATCPVCDLHLDRSSASFLGIPLTIDRGTKDATHEEVEGFLDDKHERDRLAYEHADIDPLDPDEDSY
ncbi:hypothetical protein [Williamsia muralis]|uniref:hypothetical protein n=1 Tax=Williamsia marianensis TaxID=85044 RepID=UPI000DE65CCA|nr:hypothetical protein [Williamsia marianensis]PVY28359.1 hypothetical protein C7458_10828 [Williamsia marianensis]